MEDQLFSLSKHRAYFQLLFLEHKMLSKRLRDNQGVVRLNQAFPNLKGRYLMLKELLNQL